MGLRYNEKTGEFESTSSTGGRTAKKKSSSGDNEGCSTAIGCLFWIIVIIGIIKGCS